MKENNFLDQLLPAIKALLIVGILYTAFYWSIGGFDQKQINPIEKNKTAIDSLEIELQKLKKTNSTNQIIINNGVKKDTL